jgi:Ca-activated chloride channel family protein
MKQDSAIRFILAFIIVATLMAVNPLALEARRPSQAEQKRAEDQDPVRLNATLVEVPAIVTDGAGKFVTDLAQKDFTVYEDGKRQELTVFAAVKQPFSAVLLLDTSNSAEDRLRAIQNTAVSFTRELGADDRMMVISFDNEIRQLTDFTKDGKELEKAIRGTESGFGKLLYEGVTRALEQLRGVEGRRAVIIFSDGVDMRSIDATAESAARMAEEVGAVIYAVRFDTRWWIEAEARKHETKKSKSNLPFDIDGRIPLPPDFGGPDVASSPEIPAPKAPKIEIDTGRGEAGQSRRQPPVIYDPDGRGSRAQRMPEAGPADAITENLDKLYREADTFLQTVSSRTGGRVFEAETFENTRSAFARIADEMRNLYLLGYYPGDNRRSDKYHKIKLEVARKGVQVRARPGYRR